jgi:hypothetical protein
MANDLIAARTGEEKLRWAFKMWVLFRLYFLHINML